MYLAAGSVRVVATTPDGDEVTLAIRRAGDVIGDHSALAGTQRTAGVVSLEPGEMVVAPASVFLRLLEEHPSIALEQLRRLLRMLREADERLIEIVTLDVGERVVRRLAAMVRVAGGSSVAVSQEELAEFCGASRGSVAAVLAALRRLGLVTTGRRVIDVPDLDALVAVDPALLGGGTTRSV